MGERERMRERERIRERERRRMMSSVFWCFWPGRRQGTEREH